MNTATMTSPFAWLLRLALALIGLLAIGFAHANSAREIDVQADAALSEFRRTV